jgi:hypothetical protein
VVPNLLKFGRVRREAGGLTATAGCWAGELGSRSSDQETRPALGDSVEVHPAADAEAARHALERHDVVAVLSTDGPDQLRLEITCAR